MNRSAVVSAFVCVVLVASLVGCVQPALDGSDDGDDSSALADDTDAETDGENESDDTEDTQQPTDADERDDRADEAEQCENERENASLADDENVTATFLLECNETVTLEVAATPEERAEGLMYRESLPENHGMVFVYPDADERRFWMKNTLIPLDIIYLDEDRRVLNVEHADPQPNASDSELERYPSDGPAQYVIELEQGFANETGVEPGTEVVFHDDLHDERESEGEGEGESDDDGERERESESENVNEDDGDA